jgi:predicted  nucleic acid-binding Zn-ribbon protein
MGAYEDHMPQTIAEAAKAARQHAKALAKAKERQAELTKDLAAAKLRVEELESAQKGIEYSLWEAALGEVEEVPEG